jgi:hypothetical protein
MPLSSAASGASGRAQVARAARLLMVFSFGSGTLALRSSLASPGPRSGFTSVHSTEAARGANGLGIFFVNSVGNI